MGNKDIKKILIIRNDHIGDLIMSTAVFREIKKELPNCKITAIVSKISKPIIEKNKNIAEIWELEMPQKNLQSVQKYIEMSRKIKKENFDVGVDLRGSLMNDILLWKAGVKKRVGITDSHRKNFVRKFASLFLTKPIELGFFTKDTHVTKENLEIANLALNMKSKNNWPEIPTDKEDEKDVALFLKKNKLKKYICVLPASSLKYKQWPLENWEKLINWLSKFKKDILQIGVKGEEEILRELAGKNKKIKIAINFDLRKMAILFKKSDLVVCHDGGPMHVAWTIGAKMVEVVPQNPHRMTIGKVKPLSKNATIIWAKGKDMNTIKLEEVKKAVKNALFKT